VVLHTKTGTRWQQRVDKVVVVVVVVGHSVNALTLVERRISYDAEGATVGALDEGLASFGTAA